MWLWASCLTSLRLLHLSAKVEGIAPAELCLLSLDDGLTEDVGRWAEKMRENATKSCPIEETSKC